jgi:gluconokinase
MSTALPLQLVVMGVSGSGKSTFAKAIGHALHLDWADGDNLHSTQSIAKMQAGVALDDADRWPWLDRVGHYLASPVAQGSLVQGRVIACSALKRAYRDQIRRWVPHVQFVFLDCDSELIRKRMASRAGHFMQADLLDSQLGTLERPTVQESDVLTVNSAHSVDQLLAQVIPVLQKLKHSGVVAIVET